MSPEQKSESQMGQSIETTPAEKLAANRGFIRQSLIIMSKKT